MEIAGKTAFVTGGASGIGLEIGRMLMEQGANVMLADLVPERLKAAKAELGQVETVLCDVADPGSVKAAAEKTIETFGKVHIVVNNAGVSLGHTPGDTPLEDWQWLVDINFMGVIHGIEAFTPLIKAHGEGGYFINTASMSGHLATQQLSAYTATKFAVVGLSESLRMDLAADNIGVSVLCPGWVKTDINKAHEGRPSGVDDEDAPSEAMQMVTEAVDNGLSPRSVAEWTVECMQAGRFYIFTHPSMRRWVQKRHDLIDADYGAIENDPRFKDR
ncbi:1-deoxy-11-beta-hydroxypentalenate dehydrogenase [Ascidiaceihabitans donghaensis]|uniref:1-deoxy-11-beta-hydroxypentalenate dehydrogenase n=1 Tax=Ascidiaceihabitans donghaensis TaxID=1510460 RepID=A0A2R8BI75_9RHOB|nr:SDR family NAD(P)-dependent oxidoreductase [Ascidiaceihabitans donghaensis]SPH22678.1 1-deoxy-11-beta-hydroxypentalenate dehydrogenase [Ascidiaceihabitans donghaensis]